MELPGRFPVGIATSLREHRMAIRTWSFTKLWAVSSIIWLTSMALFDLIGYYDSLQLLVLALALSPAFLAGAWAGDHPEIATWPTFRIGAMWGLGAAVGLIISDTIHWWRLPAGLLAAPLTILTLRWYEVTRPAWKALPPDPDDAPSVGPHTPTGTPLAG